MKENQFTAIRAQIFHFNSKDDYEYFVDGLLVCSNGYVHTIGNYKDLKGEWSLRVKIADHREKILMPGFVDAHIHGVQTEVMASYGADLLQWLEDYTFPYESEFSNKDFAKKATRFFYRQMLSNGTTTAAIYSSDDQESLEAIMEEALRLNMRIQSGKTSMDQNAPKQICENNTQTCETGEALIEKYHGKGRLQYLLSPRYAVTRSSEQLSLL